MFYYQKNEYMKTLHITALICAALAFTSCNDWLDLEPTTEVSTEKSIQNVRDAKASIVGLYYLMSDDNGGNKQGWASNFMFHGDVGGDDMRANFGTARTISDYAYKYTPENVSTSYWRLPYKVIRNANNILAIIDNISVLESEVADRDYVKGQALTIRAYSHFLLANTFGFPYMKDQGASLGTPLAMSKIASTEKRARNTVAEMYTAIIGDLKAAIPLMKSKSSETVGQIGKLGAQQLLARVYLYSGQWDLAFDTAKEVIDGATAAGYRLFTKEEYVSRAAWKTKNLAEGLFAFQFNATSQSGATCVPFLLNDKSDGYNDYVYSKRFYELWDPADIRKESVTKVLRIGTDPLDSYYCVKYGGIMESSEGKVSEANISILRLTESYLIAAEASTHLSDATKKSLGVGYYNAIHTRAGLTAKASITLDDVLTERRFELVGEGHRKFDLLRNNLKIIRNPEDADIQHFVNEISEASGNATIDWNSFNSIYPIPRSEMDANPNIVQNALR